MSHRQRRRNYTYDEEDYYYDDEEEEEYYEKPQQKKGSSKNKQKQKASLTALLDKPPAEAEHSEGDAELLEWARQEVQHLLIGPPRLTFSNEVIVAALRNSNYEPELAYSLLKSQRAESQRAVAAASSVHLPVNSPKGLQRTLSVVEMPPSPPPGQVQVQNAAASGVSILGSAICDPLPARKSQPPPPGLTQIGFEHDGSNGFQFDTPSPDDIARNAHGLPISVQINQVEGVLHELHMGPVSPPILPQEDKDSYVLEEQLPPPRTPIKSNASVEEDSEDEKGGKAKLSMVVVGHVDAGKSTMMGQVLLQLGKVEQRQINKYEKEARDIGKASFFLAWVMDEGTEERMHGVTMDIGTKHIQTPTKDITLLDAPGHQDFIPKMISGASQADVAILVVPATTGEFEAGFALNGQTKEHALLIRGLGVSQVLVAVNKMDASEPAWDQSRYQQIQNQIDPFLQRAGFTPKQIRFVPVSGMTGENILTISEDCPLKAWYSGPSLLECVDQFNPAQRPTHKALRAFITDIIPAGGRAGVVVAVRAVQGKVKVGQQVRFVPSADVGTIRGIQSNAEASSTLRAGDNAEITVSDIDPQRVSVGHVICKPNSNIFIGTTFSAQIMTMETLKVPLIKGSQFTIHSQSIDAPCHISKLISLTSKSGEVKAQRPRAIPSGSSACVKIKSSKVLCLEKYCDCRALGRFVLRQKGVTVAAGIITELHQ